MFKGYILGIIAVFFWSLNIIVAKYFVGTITPLQISFWRWVIGIIILLPYTIKPLWKYRHALLENWKIVISASIIGICCINTFIYIAGETSSAIDMALIGSMGPIFLVILSAIFNREKISLLQIIGFIVSIIGGVVVVMKGTLQEITFVSGDFWLLASAICFAIYGLINSMRPKEVPQVVFLSATIIIGVILLFPFYIESLDIHPLYRMRIIDWLALIYLGVFNSVIAFLCWNLAIETLGGVKTSIIYYLLPIFTTIEAFFLLHEPVLLSQIVGGVIIIVGVLITLLKTKKTITIARA